MPSKTADKGTQSQTFVAAWRPNQKYSSRLCTAGQTYSPQLIGSRTIEPSEAPGPSMTNSSL